MTDILDTLRIAVHNENPLLELVPRDKHASGKLEAERLGEYPRVVWVCEGGAITAAEYMGGRPQANPGRRVRQLYTDSMAVQLHVWGEDVENTRDIMHRLIAAIWQQAHGSVQFGSYRWVTQEEERGEFATHGQKVILEATFSIPVSERADTLTEVASQTHRGDFEPADGGATITGICQT
jgi:hypothetical protein